MSLNTQRLSSLVADLRSRIESEGLADSRTSYARTVRAAYDAAVLAKSESAELDDDDSRHRCR